MRVGVSILANSGQNIWNNGLWQNVYHLVRCLKSLPMVEDIILINCGNADAHPIGLDEQSQSVRMVRQNEASDMIDIAIEMGGALDPEWIGRFRARGGKVVFHPCGNPYSHLIEATIFDVHGFFGDPERCDQVWVLPKDKAYIPMLRTIHRCPILISPYLWDPIFVEQTAQSSEGIFGYQSGSLAFGAVRPAIFEPNVSPVKMGLIPMYICEVAERKSPGLIEKVQFMNGQHMIEQRSFVAFMQSLNLYQSGKIAIAARAYFAHIMATGCNIVVSHQLDCTQNYLYLDAIYGGYPLIHNSPVFRDVGYYYDGSDVTAGADLLHHVVTSHDENIASYTATSKKVVNALSPMAGKNREAYARLLIGLLDRSGDHGTKW